MGDAGEVDGSPSVLEWYSRLPLGGCSLKNDSFVSYTVYLAGNDWQML